MSGGGLLYTIRTIAEYARLQRAATGRYKAPLTSGAILHIAEGRTGLKRSRGAYRGREGASTRKQSIARFIITQFIVYISAVFGKKSKCAVVSTEIKCALSRFSSLRSLRFIRISAISRRLSIQNSRSEQICPPILNTFAAFGRSVLWRGAFIFIRSLRSPQFRGFCGGFYKFSRREATSRPPCVHLFTTIFTTL